jgi:hypothetical protein
MKLPMEVLAVLLITAMLTGCVAGPVRYQTLGFRTYGTAEMTREAPPSLKVPAAVAGIAVDATVTALDTVVTPLVSVPLAFEASGPCPQPTTRENLFGKVVLSPLWFPLGYYLTSAGMPIQKEGYYRQWFGEEGRLLGKRSDDSSSRAGMAEAENGPADPSRK